jgi:hypothetical protein
MVADPTIVSNMGTSPRAETGIREWFVFDQITRFFGSWFWVPALALDYRPFGDNSRRHWPIPRTLAMYGLGLTELLPGATLLGGDNPHPFCYFIRRWWHGIYASAILLQSRKPLNRKP